MSNSRPQAVLFVCTGNICRSPTAHALLLHKARGAGLSIEVDSAAVSGEELGNPPDRRAVVEARRRGVAMPAHRARRVEPGDFARFDWLVGMTHAHCAALRRLAPPGQEGRVRLLLDYVPELAGEDVPDPWFGPPAAFVEAFDLIERGVDALLAELAREVAA
ncbi:low molecular weight protein-tyrosine-phosphatase [Frateuria defendens]|uniref:low molecular weight protein-tyrosine-phosphatase n=1 Tax=Frateuria defendens TaxID=2219559 RepID=UPI0009E3496A|nr:low molecular weight protein-tyrosine-phosphatase [Frateuria defendens]